MYGAWDKYSKSENKTDGKAAEQMNIEKIKKGT